MDVPLDITPYAPPGVTELFTAIEDGAYRRLLRYAWRQVPPCTLPDDAGTLAAVAGVTQQQWSECTRLTLTWTRADGRLVLSAARSIWESQHMQASAQRERKQRAARARWDQNRPPPDARALHVHSSCIARASDAPSSEARTHAERSCAPPEFQNSSPALSAQSAPDGKDILAKLESARAQDLGPHLAKWRSRESSTLLRRAIEEWNAKGWTTLPLSKADELASCPNVTPALVQTALERVAYCLSLPEADRRKCRKPVGMLMALLGQGSRPRLIDVSLHVQAKWDKFEAFAVKQARAQAAVDAAALRMSDPPAGGGGGWAARLTKGGRA